MCEDIPIGDRAYGEVMGRVIDRREGRDFVLLEVGDGIHMWVKNARKPREGEVP